MYAKQTFSKPAELGDLGLDAGAVGQQVGGLAASAAARVGASYAATALGAGAAAGPIGIVIGGLISIFMSLFGGGKIKTPVYGMALMVKMPKNQKPLTGNLIEAGQHFNAISGNIPGTKDWNPGGTIGFTSGGTPPSHGNLAGQISNILQRQSELFAPFYDIFNRLSPELKSRIAYEPLPNGNGTSAWMDADTYMGKYAYYWTGTIDVQAPGFTAWVISNERNLSSAIDIGYTAITRHLGDILQRYSIEIDKELTAPTVQNTVANTTNAIGTVVQGVTQNITNPSSPYFWLAIGGGFLLLSSRN